MIEIAPEETETRLNWNDARMYCFSLNIDGKSGWRLPTNDELDEIYHSEHDFGLSGSSIYWSSTCDDGGVGFYVFDTGYRGLIGNISNHFKVRPVRDLKDNETKQGTLK